MVNGEGGPAQALAMSILVRMADVYGATELMDISQAHIDSTIYLGDATLDSAPTASIRSPLTRTAHPSCIASPSKTRAGFRIVTVSIAS